MQKGSSKFYFMDRHHKMERFGVLFIFFAIAFSFIFVRSYIVNKENAKFSLGTTALYTKSQMWSITEQEIVMLNIYRNSDFTKAFLAMKMSDVSEFSTNANDYRVFILSTDETGKITHNITGSFYIFGNTGYMGIMLNDAKGFEAGLAHLVIRNQARISSTPGAYSEFDEVNDTFDNYNQVEILVNLAGSDAIEAVSLNSQEINLGDLYAECLVSEEYDAYKLTLSDDLAQMNANLSVLYEYKRRLEDWGFDVPFPTCLNGDFITTEVADTAENPLAFDDSMVNASSSVISTIYNQFDINGNSNIIYYEAGDDLYLSTDFVFPGGCQYNYQNVKSTDHYLDSFMPAGVTYKDWKAQKQQEIAEYAEYRWINTDQWLLNGAVYNPSDDEYSSTVYASYNDAIKKYESTVNFLIDLKKQYQTSDLFAMFDFEDSVKSIDRITSINSTQDAIFVINNQK